MRQALLRRQARESSERVRVDAGSSQSGCCSFDSGRVVCKQDSPDVGTPLRRLCRGADRPEIGRMRERGTRVVPGEEVLEEDRAALL